MHWHHQNLFNIAGFTLAGFISTYFAGILPGFENNVVHYNRVFIVAGCHCNMKISNTKY